MNIPKVRLGKTELYVTKTAFGALPVQRVGMEQAKKLLRRAYERGINFFDTANFYTDSEEKIGEALSDVRDKIILATKSFAEDKETALRHIEQSLRMMKTDYIDLFQFHNPATLPDPNHAKGAFAAALEMQRKGHIRHIGITNHRLSIAQAAIDSGNFETLQFPFSYLTTHKELQLVNACQEADLGFIAMKGLSGGLLTNAAACYAFMGQYPHVVPIWGIQHEWELEQWLDLTEKNQTMTPELEAIIAKDRKELSHNFCRSCGYCLPCAAEIDIPQSARMAMLLRRAPSGPYLTQEWWEKMHRIENCTQCGLCKERCPYALDLPNLLQEMLKDYDMMYAQYHSQG